MSSGSRLGAALVLVAGFAIAAPAIAAPTTRQLIGEKLVVSMNGRTPSDSLLWRARTGRIGGVLIHGYNFTSATQLRSIAWKLQHAAKVGAQPPLLIAVDQEGGPVKTIPWIPPTISPRRMGEIGDPSIAAAQGRKTGAALRGLRINTDLAPVADVPASTASFMYQQGRTWSFSAWRTTRLADAFAVGLGARDALATMKHFPGLGYATRNTDTYVVHIHATQEQLAPGLKPYQRAIADHVPLIMLSNALYEAYDRSHPAGWSHAIGARLLRKDLGFQGATITDSLDGAAHARGIPTAPLAVKAAQAGTDFLLLTGSEAASQGVYKSLVDAVGSGEIGVRRLRVSYQRILALKALI